MKRLLLMLLAVPAVANAQTPDSAKVQPVSPIDAFYACQHPSLRDAVKSESSEFKKLKMLCTTIRNDGRTTLKQRIEKWQGAFLPDALPKADELRKLAEDAQRQRIAGTIEKIELPRIKFDLNSTTIVGKELDKVKVMVDMIRNHLQRFPDDVITITGSADEDRGGPELNRVFAEDRRDALMIAVRKADDVGDIRRLIGTNIKFVARVVTKDSIKAAKEAQLTKLGTDSSDVDVQVERHIREDSRNAAATVEPGSSKSEDLAESPAARQPFSLTGSSMTTALADAVISQANAQLQLYLVEEVSGSVCRELPDMKPEEPEPAATDTTGHAKWQKQHEERQRKLARNGRLQISQYLKNTCGLFGDGAARELYVPTLSSLHKAIAEDLRRELPPLIIAKLITTEERAARPIAGENRFSAASSSELSVKGAVSFPTPTREVRLQSKHVAAIAMLYYLQSVISGGDAIASLQRLPDDVQSGLDRLRESGIRFTDDSRVLDYIRGVGPYARVLRDARGWDAVEFKDSLVVQATRALAVNFMDQTTDFQHDASILPQIQRTLAAYPRITAAANKWSEAYQALKNIDREEARVAALAGLLASSLDVLLVPLEDVGVTSDQMRAYRNIAVPVRDVMLAISTNDYRGALVQTTTFLRSVSCDKVQPGCSKPLMLESEELRWLNFAADVANAKAQEDVTQAFKGFLSQSGGYRMKRHGDARAFFTVNAYLGVAGGREYGIRGGKDFLSAAFYLPVGIERVWRRDQIEDKDFFRSFGVFVQVLDLGGVAATRIRDKDVNAPDPAIADVLSPGVFGIFALGNSPWSFGFGGAINPRAQNVRVDEEIKPIGAFRLNAFIAFDVPLFP